MKISCDNYCCQNNCNKQYYQDNIEVGLSMFGLSFERSMFSHQTFTGAIMAITELCVKDCRAFHLKVQIQEVVTLPHCH